MAGVNQYINYDDIKDSKEGTILIKCYHNGNRWLCPDPKHTILCDKIDQWCNASSGIQYKEILITEGHYFRLTSSH